MEYTKQDYIAAKEAANVAYKAMNSTSEAKAWSAALDRLEEVQEALGAHSDTCEGCGEPIFDDDPKCHDPENGVSTCLECSPTWADFQSRPEDFERWDEADEDMLYHTPETGAPLIAAHLANGGALTDSMAT